MSSPTGRKRPRVLVLIKGLGMGGAESLIAAAAPFWDLEHFEYQVAYLLPWKDQLVPRLTAGGTTVTCLNWQGPSSVGVRGRLHSLLETFQPDIIHSHLPVAGVLARSMGRTFANVYTEHNIVEFYREPTRSLNRVTYGRNDAVIAVSSAVAESLEGYPGPNPKVIPNGVVIPKVNDHDKAAVREELEIDASTPLVIHIGNIRPHKGHWNLTRAVALLARERPDVLVVSVGGEKHPGDLERVRAAARELGVSSNVRFMGTRPDATSFIAAGDVFVNPSDVEGLPVSILEALALGRPVVATDVGGVSTVVKNGETGLLVPPGEPETLAAALREALESHEARRWGENGKMLVRADHGMATMVGKYESVYRAVSI